MVVAFPIALLNKVSAPWAGVGSELALSPPSQVPMAGFHSLVLPALVADPDRLACKRQAAGSHLRMALLELPVDRLVVGAVASVPLLVIRLVVQDLHRLPTPGSMHSLLPLKGDQEQGQEQDLEGLEEEAVGVDLEALELHHHLRRSHKEVSEAAAVVVVDLEVPPVVVVVDLVVPPVVVVVVVALVVPPVVEALAVVGLVSHLRAGRLLVVGFKDY